LFFILDETDHLPGKLVEEGLACQNVDHGKLDATDVGARHGYLLHGVDTPYSLDH